MPDAVIVSAARSPIGRAHKGSLTAMRADDLAAQVEPARIEAALGEVIAAVEQAARRGAPAPVSA